MDNAYQFWQVVNIQLGLDSNIYVEDTLPNVGSLQLAVNSCIRKLAAHLGIPGSETITIVKGTFIYTLASKFIEDGIASREVKAFAITSDGNTIYGLTRGAPRQITNLVEVQSGVSMFDFVGDRIWLSHDAKDGTSVYIEGHVVGVTMTDGADTTNVLDQDRNAVCDCATAIVGWGSQHPSAGIFWQRFVDHVSARGGVAAGLVP